MEGHRRVGRTAAELTFWTLCPYCYYAHEYDKAYEECCLRCANCRRGFHAAAIRAPPEASAFDGDEAGHSGAGGGWGHYKCRMGLFPLRYDWGARGRGEEEEEVEEMIDVGDYLVDISSSDEDEDEDGREREANVGNEGGEGTKRREGESELRDARVGMEVEEEKGEESCGGELEFEYEGDDILVSAA